MHTKEQIKNSGATFTPSELADFLANKIIPYIRKQGKNFVLDPACGTGQLLLSISNKLSQLNYDYELTGYETNSHFLRIARERLQILEKDKVKLFESDFLESINVTSNDLFSQGYQQLNNKFDIVIANPPYVRTQILGSKKAQYYSKKFNLKGRVDLYYPFLIAMTESITEDGILAVITSNRYLSTKSGESIRKFLMENYDIIELIDLGDTKLFNAAVLPAIFLGIKKRKKTLSAKFIKIYEAKHTPERIQYTNSIYDILSSKDSGFFDDGNKIYKKTIGTLLCSGTVGHNWKLLSDIEQKWIKNIERASKYRIKNFFNVKVGVKSTADKVFISDQWEELGTDKPEDELLKSLISQENIESWGATENDKLKILYPHEVINDIRRPVNIKDYPKAYNYLKKYYEILSSRKYLIEAGRNWYEIWVPHNPDLWKLPKLVFPDISAHPRFHFDERGKIVNGNCYWIVANKDEDVNKLLFIQGVANSNLMTKYHDLTFNNKLYSGRRRYFTQFVEEYPLPDIDSPGANEIILLVKKLNQTGNRSEIDRLKKFLEIKIAELFEVEPIITLG